MSGPTKERPDKPQLIVGIDFGLTGTSVAWALPSKDKVQRIDTWPNLIHHAGKVPSAVVLEGPDGESAWGFSTRKYRDSPQHPVYILFKAVIGRYNDSYGDPFADSNAICDEKEGEDHLGSQAESDENVGEVFRSDTKTMTFHRAKACLTEYLEGLYAHIKKELSMELPRGTDWHLIRAWFLFSYPTTWSATSIERFRNIVESSGFGHEKYHWVNASYMDEAQAAMASFCTGTDGSRPTPGKIILIADIGGGTTDVNKYLVEEDDGKRVKLRVETDPSGRNYGSVHVDYRVTKNLRRQILTTLSSSDNPSLRSMSLDKKESVAEEQAGSILGRKDYMHTKHGIDGDSPLHQEECYPLSLTRSTDPVATLRFQMHGTLKREFKKECQRIWDQIEEHAETRPEGSVDHLVLTGGMTRNVFVRDWFKGKVRDSQKTFKPIRDIIFLKEPETTISKGMVHDALESYKRDGLWLYKSLHSYGIVAYNSEGQVETKRQFLAKGQVIDPKKLKEKQTVRFKLAHQVGADLRLARWDNEDGDDSITTVGSLTADLPPPTEWDPSWSFGCDAKVEVELSFERRTATVSFCSKEKTRHRLVFNEEWHSGTARRPASRPLNFETLANIGLGILGLLSSIIIGVDIVPRVGGGTAASISTRDASHATAQEINGNDGVGEGGGQFDSLEEA
ncbi:unnamed protein product [Colletotrichum noveboracense]|uniref:Hsp70-like protein n=1 Tax=Colletotrichum noveboracense TaxID=2664923 RepID=A0A9W4WN77_9PEZI|nr:unnamed protein product [Colletotrichum noveboracense]